LILDINDSCETDASAALSLCNEDLQLILGKWTDAGSAGYVAITSLEKTLVLLTLRKKGNNSMVFALLQEYEEQYALERVAEAGRMDLFRIIKPFITSGKHCAFAAFKSAVRIGHGPLMHGLIGFISEGDLIEAFQLACESAYAPSNLIQSLIQEIPIGLRTQACTDAFESAITRGKVELLRVLITGGANVNKHFNNEMWESDERICLHWLGMWGLSNSSIHHAVLAMVNIVCASGADVNAVDYEERTPLHLFALAGYYSVKSSIPLEDNSNDEFKRVEALYRCSLLTIIHAGADIDAKDKFGKTPLHLAVEKGEIGMVRLLMELGVNSLITDDESVRASRVNGTRGCAPHMIDFQVWKYEQLQEKRVGEKWAKVL
jgi:hypothetical protein